ncbi:MAG TPA: YceI family protein [Polyangiaceae bacterium]|nr:YceI family protein [Polyangiaceae bacterium]
MFFKMRSAYFVAAACSILTVTAVASAKYKLQNQQIQVKASGPGGMEINGKSSNLVLDESDTTLSFKGFLNAVNTGNSMRNGHLQERFDAKEDKFNAVVLTIPKDAIDEKVKSNAKVKGTLKFHNQTKPVDVTYSVNEKKHVNASFSFNVTDHGIDPKKLCYLGVCAKETVKIIVDFDF